MLEQFFDLGQPQLRTLGHVLQKRMPSTSRDLIATVDILFGVIGLHVGEKLPCCRGRDLEGLSPDGHVEEMGISGGFYESGDPRTMTARAYSGLARPARLGGG
ncbi:hypothetical protein [Bradyrhizobium sp. LTSPM299]|uniref:hypothetical protein n=1 Tax=Bradyrhizobium sp. LTSPM299 TaxID=1619233 RepID=UPI0012E10CDF|nr:hypothetical protein [Bradyrhizobium sp. LTSPM299]